MDPQPPPDSQRGANDAHGGYDPTDDPTPARSAMHPVDDAVDLGREVGDGARVVDHVVGVFEFGVEGELG